MNLIRYALAVFFGLKSFLGSPSAAAQTTTTTAVTSTTIHTVTATDNSSSATTYTRHVWGEMGLAKLHNAPFPDDSRTTAYQTRNSTFPYEGHYDDPTVVFAIPAGYHASKDVDLIVHFHGWSNEASRALSRYRLGEQLTSSGRNAILLIPQGPKNSKDSSIGKIQKPDGLKNLVTEAIEKLVADGKLPSGAHVRTIVLGGHSGGYLPIGRCLDVGGMRDLIKEVWLWDAAYGEWDAISQFGARKGSPVMRSLFTDHLMDANVRIICMLQLQGKRPVLLDEDDLTSVGTTASTFSKQKIHGATAGVGKEEIDEFLKREPLFFMHTHLEHDNVMHDRNYFERFARLSPNLQPR